jgi:hypothetical protein
MSLISPAPAMQAQIDKERLDRTQAYQQLHEKEILRDFHSAKKHFGHPDYDASGRMRPYVIRITPAKLVIRSNDKSFMKDDFEGPGCDKVKMLRIVYRALCPAGYHVEFDKGEIKRNAPCVREGSAAQHLEDIYVPVIKVFKDTVERKKSRRMR